MLAHHLADRPEVVVGRRVLDLGCGSGLVGIAAMKAGAASVLAVDVDPNAIVAAGMNAEANAVRLETLCADPLDGPPMEVEIVLAGDVFYDARLAGRMLPFLERCVRAGQTVLIGDPWRTFLPEGELTEAARYGVPDFGAGKPVPAGVCILSD